MADISDLTWQELTALAKAAQLWEELVQVLGKVEAYPRSGVLHIETEQEPGYLGWIGYGEHGAVAFQPASKEAGDA